jgi:glycogen phosphorylase
MAAIVETGSEILERNDRNPARLSEDVAALFERHLQSDADIAPSAGARETRALCALYADPDGWARKAILNIAASGPFSSDETISRYANRNLAGRTMSCAGVTAAGNGMYAGSG